MIIITAKKPKSHKNEKDIDKKEKFIVERPVKFGGSIGFNTYKEVEDAFVEKKLHPLDLKIALAKEINRLLSVFDKNRDKSN